MKESVTLSASFGAVDFHGKRLFSVNEGLCVEDALLHARQLLHSAQASANDTAGHLTANDQALVLGIAQHVEMAKALLDAVLAKRHS